MSFKSALMKAKQGEELCKKDIMYLLSADGREQKTLFGLADEMRYKNCGDVVHLRGIIEFSNCCRRDCYYCGLRCSNDKVERYRMEEDELIEATVGVKEIGFYTVVLQSGEDSYYSAEMLSRVIKAVKGDGSIAVTLSIGERIEKEYRLFKDAGADRFLLKHETSDEKLFKRLRRGMELKERLECLKILKRLGYEIGSGNIVGLPGQTLESIAEDILLFQKLEVDMVGIGPFIPHPDTPLGCCARGSLELTLKVLAVTRLVLPKANLPATTAIATLHQSGYELALNCGANVIMPNLTPMKFKNKYQIYPNKKGSDLEAAKLTQKILDIINSMGRKAS